LIVLAFLSADLSASFAQTTCKSIRSVPTLVLEPMSNDVKASLADAANEAENDKVMAPIVDLFQTMRTAE